MQAVSPWSLKKQIDDILSEEYVNPRLTLAPGRDVVLKALPVIYPAAEQRGLMSTAPSVVTEHRSQQGIAVMRLDGLGGTVTLSDQAAKIYERTGKKVTLVTRGYETLFEENPHIEKVINVGMRDWRECSLVMRNQFESLAEVRFGLGKWFSPNGYFKLDKENLIDVVDGFFEKFPIDFNQLGKYGLHHVQLTDKTLSLPYDTIESKVFTDEVIDFKGVNGSFVLINNGVDIIHGGMRQTKCWDGWGSLVEQLKGTTVVQTGTLNDTPVRGAVDLRGKTNIKQVVYLLKKAAAVVVTEGGLMHLAYASQSPNVVVLGGPTQGVLFAYPGHTWITSYICGNCWSTRGDWYERCPKDANAVCMATISPFRVAEKVRECLR